MARLISNWRSPDGVTNAQALQAEYAEVFEAISKLDALGHRLLKRASDSSSADNFDKIVGLSLLRRAVTQFVGTRHLLEASCIQPAAIIVRSLLETHLSMRYLVHGGRRRVALETPSSARAREARARYYYVAAIRADICRRQALLDGKEGVSRVTNRQERKALELEIRQEIIRLERHFPVQQRRFGPLPCFPSGGKRPRYHDVKPWYSFGFRKRNVSTIKALAERLGVLNWYFLFYSPVSALGHAQGTGYDSTIVGPEVGLYSPYVPDGFEYVTYCACGWQGMLLAYFARAYHPQSFEDTRTTVTSTFRVMNRMRAEIPSWFYFDASAGDIE